jgi:hypothetical protein
MFQKTMGPARCNRKLCNNVEDFFTFDTMDNISPYVFISFKDTDQFVYGFHLTSLHKLVEKPNPANPYTRNPLSPEIVDIVKRRVRYNAILGKPYEEPEVLVPLTLEQKARNVFDKIDSLGNYTQPEWFLTLTPLNVRRFLLQLYDIWTYRAQLTPEAKAEVCPPNGVIFLPNTVHRLQHDRTLTPKMVKTYAVDVIRTMVFSARTESAQALGATYVLMALTLVSPEAAAALPWLFESVS